MTARKTSTLVTSVKAEEAPIGMPLWPTRTPEAAVAYTLESVCLVRTATESRVVWTYLNGTTVDYAAGEMVAVQIES